MKRFCCPIAMLATLVLLALGGAGALLLRGGISARPAPSAAEARIARWARHHAIPGEARAARNPIPAGPGPVADGLAHFADHCAVCHANDGSGDTPIGRGLYPRAPDLRADATQSLPDGELHYIIEEGIRLTGMPAWGAPGTAAASWHLVHFIRHLPVLTPGELDHMEALNPRPAAEWRAREAEERFLRGESRAPPAGAAGHHPH